MLPWSRSRTPTYTANSYIGGYAKTCHPSTKNKYSKLQIDFPSCNLAKGERGHRKKKYMLNEHRKKCAPIEEHRKKRKIKHDPLQNKSKRRISKQGVFRKVNKNIPTHLHISIKLHD
jgi:hypothetical protein